MSVDQLVNNTVTFLTQNILLSPASVAPEGAGPHGQSGAFKMRLRKSGTSGVRLATNTPCDVFSIERPDKWNGTLPEFTAYFCYYETDEVHMMIVDDDANLMFTPTMDGCSFGVGSANPNGARLVGHANITRTASTQTGAQQQAATQDTWLLSAMPGGSLMSQAQYLPFGSGQAGTTFGVRNPGNGAWSFYTQVWKRVSTTYQLCQPELVQFV